MNCDYLLAAGFWIYIHIYLLAVACGFTLIFICWQVSGPSAPACCQLTAQVEDLRSLHVSSYVSLFI